MGTLSFIPSSPLVLETGSDKLLTEDSNALTTEDSFEAAIQVIDENPVLAISYYWLQPSFSFQADPGTLFEKVWLPGTGQQMQETLMPVYDERFLGGDIANMPYEALQLFANIHFGPDATDNFTGPEDVDILEGSSDVELRTPE